MEVLEKIMILKSAKSKICRLALQYHISFCLGFILGVRLPEDDVILEFPLVALQHDGSMYLSVVEEIIALNKYLISAELTAKTIGRSMLGVFGSWDHQGKYNAMRLGALVDYARQLDAPYVLVQPTDGGESIWNLQLYKSWRFPKGSYEYKTLRKRSDKMSDNPRRVQALWRNILADQQIDVDGKCNKTKDF